MRKRDFDKLVVGATAILFQADTGEQAGAADSAKADTEVAKRKVADHYLIDANGAKVEEEELATGIGYQIVGTAKAFEFQTGGTAGQALTMLAVFGAKTLATNESSAARNRKEDPADAEGQMDAVRERFALIGNGKWVDRSREGAGAKIDLDALTAAIVEVAANAAQPRQLDPVQVLQKLTDDPTFKKTVRQVPDIARAYAARVGKQEKTLDEALAGL